MRENTYDLHGLRIRSSVALDEPEPCGVHERAPHEKARFDWGHQAPVPAEAPAGHLLATAEFHGRRFYSAVRDDAGFTLRFHGACDVRLDAELRGGSCHPAPGTEDGLVGVLLGGTGLSVLLNLRGHCVLHASAVEVDGRAVALVGRSGMGKTTSTALLCAAGLPLVADDVLRIDLSGPDLACFRGSSGLRLRPHHRQALDAFDNHVERRQTPDGRLRVRPPRTVHDTLPLAHVVVPVPAPDVTTPEARGVHASDASLLLASFPRVAGWVDHDQIRRGFVEATRVAARVPVTEVRIPWGPPFTREAALAFRATVEDLTSR